MHRALLLTTTAVVLLNPLTALAEDQVAQVDEVVVMGKRVIREHAAATGLDLSLRDTPQSVTVINAEHLRRNNLTDVNQVLAGVPGVNVESVETDRTYYNSRGFDVVNFQIDGIGQPLDWGAQNGALDIATYERIEVVRGANGLMTAVGNPSATINYIRKRPTDVFSANASAGYGTWDTRRLSADISGPLNDSGTVKGRLVYANTDGGSNLDYYNVNRNVYYGIGSWEITPKLNATAGFSRQDNLANGVNWGALPLLYSDGTRINYDRSATTAAPWTYWDTFTDIGFGELSYGFDNGWTIKAIYTHRQTDEESKLLYALGAPDRITGLGIGATSGIYTADITQDMFDVVTNGYFSLFGREHQLAAGFNISRNDAQKTAAPAAAFTYPAMVGNRITPPAHPQFPAGTLAESVVTDQQRAFVTAHLSLTDQLKAVVGFNAVNAEMKGNSYGTVQDSKEGRINPYVGVVYDASDNISLYASYSDLFTPQSEGDLNRRNLGPAEGSSYEAGVKSEWLDKRLYATAAIFQSKQTGLAEYVGRIPGTVDAYYRGVDTKAQGYEFEVAGRPTSQWNLGASFTHLKIEDGEGKATRLYVPRNSFKVNTSYVWPEYRNLTLGGALRWQGDIKNPNIGTGFTQEAYAVVDVSASVDLTPNLTARVNAKNLFDEGYLTSLQWDQAFYAPTRSVMFTLDYRY